jgi:hypothetical protein
MANVVGDIAGGLLEPFEEIDRLLGEAVQKAGQLIEQGGDGVTRAGELVASWAAKIDQLQHRLAGDQQAEGGTS